MSRPQKKPTLRFYDELKNNPYQNNPPETQNSSPLTFYVHDELYNDPTLLYQNFLYQTENAEDITIDTLETSTLTSTSIDKSQTQSQIQTEKLSNNTTPTSTSTSTSKQRKARKKSDKSNLTEAEKKFHLVSHQLSSQNRVTEVEKLSRATPVIYAEKRLQSKTALTLVHLYSQEMSPEQINLMLDYREELQLTHSELVALSLLKDMDSKDKEIREKATNRYWKIQETIEKSKKQSTSVTPKSSSLLEQKLADAKDAIFGEIVEKGVDNKNGV